jgi:T5SS/PEP-CTERM-associated repeat protein
VTLTGSNVLLGIDTPVDCTSVAQGIADAHYKFVIRYYWDQPNSSVGTALSKGEVEALKSAGLDIVAVWENSGNPLPGGTGVTNQGTIDAESAIKQAHDAGQDDGSAIYFAVEPGQPLSEAETYFSQIDNVFNDPSKNQYGYKVGVYGTQTISSTLKSLGSSGGVSYTWITGASYASTFNDAEWSINQIAVSDTVNHSSLDPNNVITVTDPLNGNAVLKGVDIDAAQGLFGAFGAGTNTTAPVISSNSPISVKIGGTGTITSNNLNASEGGFSSSQLTYTVTGGPADGTLFENGSASIQFTQAEIDSGLVTYRENGPNVSSDAFSFQLTDTGGGSTKSSFIINVRSAPPMLSGAGNESLYVSGETPLVVDAGITVTDGSEADLTGATVAIALGFLSGDVLNFTNQNGITGNYSSVSRTLVLSGLASVADYQTALESVTFSSTATDATNGGVDSTRTISWAVSDSQSTSASVVSGVSVWPPLPPSSPPVLSGGGNIVSYRSTGGSVSVDGGLTATDAGTGNLFGASIAIGPGLLAGDILNSSSFYGIVSKYNSTTGTLTLSGLATLAEYNVVLDSVNFSSTAADATNGGTDNTRTISWSVNDGRSLSATVTSTINVYPSSPPIGDQPYVDTNAFSTVEQGGYIEVSLSDLEVTDPNPSFPSYFYGTSLINSAITYTIVQGPQHGTLTWDTDYPTLWAGGPLYGGQPVTIFTQNDIHNYWFKYINNGSSPDSDSFSFTVSDGYGGTIGLTTVTIPIAAIPPLNPLPRTLVWAGTSNSSLANALNWDDTTNNASPANSAPNATDTAVFTGAASVTDSTSFAALTLSGAASLELTSDATLAASGAVTIGDGASADITIQGGAELAGGNAVIAGTSGASGSSINVNGAGSQLNVSALLDVGVAGSGSLELSGGAIASAGTLDAANSASAVGQVSVSGTGSNLSVAGSAIVGDDGTGVLSVLNGATFSSQSLTIGSQADSSGALVVSGTGSMLSISGQLNIGTALGTGDLTVGPGATVNAAVVNLQGGVVLEGGLLDPTVFIENGGSTTGGFGTIASDFILLEGTILSNGSKSGKQTEVVQGTLVGGGTATVKGSVSVNGPGILQIGTHDTIELSGAVLNAATTTFTDNLTPTGTYSVNNSVVDVVFQDATGVLQLDDIAGFAGTVATWKGGDSFVITGGTLSNLGVTNGDTLTFSDAGTGAGAGGIDSIIFGSAITAGGFGIANGNTIVACFAEGTRIQTEDGPIAVEELTLGDRVTTVEGACEAIVWLGRRTVNCRAHPTPEAVWPVCVRAGAFGPGMPVRDLYLSPDHAVFMNGVLIPVKLLIDGAAIARMPRDSVTYFHVELPRHAVILAEGLPVESYLDTGDRANFEGEGEAIRLFPEFAARFRPQIATVWETSGAAVLVLTGENLAIVQRAVAVQTQERYERHSCGRHHRQGTTTALL